jgi:methionyl-tRNA formyltransferase
MKILYAGCRDAGIDCLQYLIDKKENVVGVLTIENSERLSFFGDVKKLAEDNNIPVFTSKNLSDDLESIKKLKPDTLFSVFYLKKIPKELLDMCEIAINFHGAKLPDYKGSFTNIWAIINGEKETAVTAHILTEELDKGDIVDSIKLNIDNTTNGFNLYMSLSLQTVILFKQVFTNLKEGKLIRTPQSEGGNYYERKLPYDGYIDPAWDINRIDRFVRALYFPPLEPARLRVGNKDMVIHRTMINKEGKLVFLEAYIE